MGEAGGTHGDKHHRRVRADCTAPSHRDEIRMRGVSIAVIVATAYQNCRERIEHVAAAPGLFAAAFS